MKKLIYRKGLAFDEPIGITNGTFTLKECRSARVDPFVIKYHYSHKATKNRFKSFLINKDKGFIQLGYGIRPDIKHTVSTMITKDNYCEFDRMWLSDECPKNSESQVIGLLLSYLKQVYKHISFVITYADESAGNTGVIYKATNAFSLGSVPVDFYLLSTGERVHPVSMWHRHGTRKGSVLSDIYPSIKHIKTGRQFRFLYILDKKIRKQFLKDLL